MTKTIKSLVVLGSVLVTTHSSADSCLRSKDELDQANAKLYQTAKSQVTNGTEILDRCYKGTTDFLDRCSREKTALQSCRNVDEKLEVSAMGLSEAGDALIDRFVTYANCHFAMSTCYRRGPLAKQSLASEVMSLCNDGVNTLPAGEQTAIYDYYQAYFRDLKDDQFKCWRKAGDGYESLAENTLKEQVSKDPAALEQQSVDCVDHDNGNRVCVFTASGGSRFREVPNGGADAIAEGASPARLSFQSGGKCSGTLLGDGRTVVTSGHCTSSGSAVNPIEVFDSTGKSHLVSARCESGYSTGYQSISNTVENDFSICHLDQRIISNPIYVATYSPMMAGNGCSSSGFVMTCGRGYFENLSQKPVTMTAFPVQRDGVTMAVAEPKMMWTTGVLRWDNVSRNLKSDMICTGGCSGAGYLVNEGGRQVLVAVHGYDNRYASGKGGGPTIPSEDFTDIYVASIDTGKLAAGGELFQTMTTL